MDFKISKWKGLGTLYYSPVRDGAGKTRILKKIFDKLGTKPTFKQFTAAEKQFHDYEVTIKNAEAAITNWETMVKAKLDDPQAMQRIQSQERKITSAQHQMAGIKENILDWKFIETSELSETYQAIPFVPKELDLQDSNKMARAALIKSARQTSIVGIDNLHKGTYARIQVTQDRRFNATHPETTISAEDKVRALKDYSRLTDIIHTFLGTTLDRNIDGEATLFGFPMGRSNLSEGQRVLLQLCLAIHSQESALKDLILIIDEPENHLHPSVLMEVLDILRDSLSNGQIWIATHSVPLLAHFDPSDIWYVESGEISYAGNIPEKVLSSLLGDENEIARVLDFISLPAQYSSSRYAFQCLTEPTSAEMRIGDPQSVQIRSELLELSSSGKIRVLDFGAGKGRVIANISDMDQASRENLIDKLDYIAYDPATIDKSICEGTIASLYGDSTKRYFNNIRGLLSIYDKNSFHVVLMCNVLHEIDPKDWLDLFNETGQITSLLDDAGVLLLVEDHQIPIGEKAYQKGFLVLDTPQLKELFKITEQDIGFKFNDAREGGRLKAHHIPKGILSRINASSRIQAIESTVSRAKEEIKGVRKLEASYKNGKLHGFWVQQLANAELTLSELSVK